MVTKWGMSDVLGPVSYKLSDDDPFLGREIHQQRQFSEYTMQIIDQEVAAVLHQAFDSALQLLEKHRDQLEIITRALLDKEEINDAEIAELIGPSVHDQEPAPLLAAGETVTAKSAQPGSRLPGRG
jgi:cell division protease FtsH